MPRDKKEHLLEVLKDFDIALLSTRTDAGHLRGRPMALAAIQDDGIVYFCANVMSDVVKQLEVDPHVGVTVQSKSKYASLCGQAKVNHDRELVGRFWKEGWKLWFPKGKDDPDLCLIEFDAAEGEYWDTSGISGMKFVIQATKAYLSGEKPDNNPDQHAKVVL
jgi:general stress protein 26